MPAAANQNPDAHRRLHPPKSDGKMRHNNVLPNQHFRKDWQRRVKTWFDQPGAKKRRRAARAEKAARVAPRPVDLLRPAVRGQTVKYNTKLRAGRGFTLEELKAAGVRRKEALTIGIAVDHRRKNRSEEGMAANVERLKAYKAALVVFPRRSTKPRKGDATAEEIQAATQLKGKLFPIAQPAYVQEYAAVEESEVSAYATLRKAANQLRYKGIREIRAKAKAAEAAEAAK